MNLFIETPNKAFQLFKENLNFEINEVIKSSTHFETFYDIKVFSLGLINLVHSLLDQNYDLVMVANILKFLIYFMKLIQNLEIVKSYTKLSKQRKLGERELEYFKLFEDLKNNLGFQNSQIWFNTMLYGITNEDDDSFGESIDMHEEKIKNTQEIFSKILETDEYLKLRELITKIDNQPQYKPMLDSIKENIYLNDVCFNTKYVIISMYPKITRLRRILRYKRKNHGNQIN